MERKSFSLGEFKALSGKDDAGTFEALVGVFGNVDAGGDRIQRGAFKRSLSEWSEKGRSIPVLWSHDAESVPIGVITKAAESIDGLRVKARLFIEGHDRAREVYEAMKGGALHEFSFGYAARDFKNVIENGKKVRVLKDIHLGEISPVFAGMNPETHLLGIKSLPKELEDLEAEREMLDRKIAELKAAADAVTELPEETTPPEEAEPEAEQPAAEGEQEHDDNPEPNPAEEAGEEATARIRALQVAKPQHLE